MSTKATRAEHLNIVVAGQGAIGSLWCWHLRQARAIHLSLLTKTRHEQTKQLCFSNIQGLSYQYTCHVASDESLAQADLLVVCLKSYDAASLVNSLAAHIAPTTDILLVHNGMGVVEALSTEIKSTHAIFTCLTTHGAFRPSQSHSIHTGLGRFDIGRHDHTQMSPPHWFAGIKQALPNAHWQTDINTKQWQKLAINCVINPLTALNDVRNGKLTQADYLPQISAIANEVAQVATSQGIELTAQVITEQALRVAAATAKNVSSTLADVRANRATEIHAINGYICQLAAQAGIKVPINEALVAKVANLSARNAL
ncbi:2-dehydropantoate 2-reductase [Thalassotalea euphylliae]|uniref:2-dehydropantoate 2-reductase n=1 Tax=Thalassotalea euphylliae TaxID=1655234 RepID=A0A3E0TTB3_9GAMM|nr:2-dehydropantoate 2-reductase [Thalassotalea euphylliae]REL27921.1 2-dehydropantoate 2-reductase [Thalassotalea euphylliae]